MTFQVSNIYYIQGIFNSFLSRHCTAFHLSNQRSSNYSDHRAPHPRVPSLTCLNSLSSKGGTSVNQTTRNTNINTQEIQPRKDVISTHEHTQVTRQHILQTAHDGGS